MNIRSLFAILLGASFTLTAPSEAGVGKPVKVFLCAGQSNMAGAGNRDGLLPEDEKLFPSPTIRLFFADPKEGSMDTWGQLGEKKLKFGPEALFGILMEEKFPDHEIAIVKVSRGSTAIKFWLPPGNGFTTLEATVKKVAGMLDSEKSAGEIPGWAWGGFVWMQGEGDANGAISPPGEYLGNLHKLAELVRAATSTPDLPIVLGRISWQLSPSVVRDSGDLRVSRGKAANGKGIREGADFLDDGQRRGPIWFDKSLVNVRNDQEVFSKEDPRAAFVDIDDIVLKDSYHYNAGGYAEMGRRFAKAFFSITSPKADTP